MNASSIKTWPTLARDFGSSIRDFRNRLKLSPEELAGTCGLSDADGADVIQQIEHGLELPNIGMLVTLAQGLQVSPGALLADALWKATRGHLFDDALARHYWSPCLFRAGYYTQYGAVSLDKNAYDTFSAAFGDGVNIQYARGVPEPQFVAVYVQCGLLRLDPDRDIRKYRWVRHEEGDA